MSKINQNFQYDNYNFLHRPIRQSDQKDGRQFLERFMFGAQRQFELAFTRIKQIVDLYNPEKTPQPRLLKDIVGLTKELDNITRGISDSDLRKLITLAVALWKQKGLEIGYVNIIRLFTGRNARVFNWFDFRLIVGESSFGEEQLGEDTWLISKTNVGATAPAGNVVLYLPFENVLRDRSLIGNLPTLHGAGAFHLLGPVIGSEWYLRLFGGYLSLPDHPAYAVGIGSFTIEGFFRTGTTADMVLFKKSFGTKHIELRYNTLANTVSFSLHDGVTNITGSLPAVANLDDSVWRHVALIVNRTTGFARLYLGGAESTAAIALGAIGDLTNAGIAFVGAASPAVNLYAGDMDNFRLSLSVQYVITGGTIPVPPASFIEYQEEQLDEFFTDVRVVDDGTLNHTLVKRILNLMRPVSERLRVIYTRVFEDFKFGKGDLITVVPGSLIQDKTLRMPAGSVEVFDATGSADFRDIVLQVKAKVESGNLFRIRFMVQNSLNYYDFSVDVVAQTATLRKVVAGVPTVLAGPTPFEIFEDTYYMFTVITDYNSIADTTQLKTHIDSNVVHNMVDATFDKGSFGMESGAGSVSVVEDIEMFLMPLTFETVLPNQVI